MELIEQTGLLTDAAQRQLGTVSTESLTNDLLVGSFTPGPDFAAIEKLFHQFEDAVDAQALSVVDELDVQIAKLHLQLYFPEQTLTVAIHDVQIWRDGGFTCRFPSIAALGVNGRSSSVENGHFARHVSLMQSPSHS
jgi:hypothetical protein